MVYSCRRITFVVFKIVLHFRVVLRLWKSLSYVWGGGVQLWKIRFTFVGVLRSWAGLHLRALHTHPEH